MTNERCRTPNTSRLWLWDTELTLHRNRPLAINTPHFRKLVILARLTIYEMISALTYPSNVTTSRVLLAPANNPFAFFNKGTLLQFEYQCIICNSPGFIWCHVPYDSPIFFQYAAFGRHCKCVFPHIVNYCTQWLSLARRQSGD